MSAGVWGQRQVPLQDVIDRFVIVTVATAINGPPGWRVYDTLTETYQSRLAFEQSWKDRLVAGTGQTVGKFVTGDNAEAQGVRVVRDAAFSFADPALTVVAEQNGDRLFNTREPFAGETLAAAQDEPQQAEWDAMIRYLHEVVAQGDKDYFRYVLRWLAHVIQCPTCKPGVALTLQGPSGSGKSTFDRIVVGLFAPYWAIFDTPEALFGSFTGHLDKLRGASLAEALFAGSNKDADRAKHLITSSTLDYHGKGKDRRQGVSHHAFTITTNHAHAIPAMANDRRYAPNYVDFVPGWEKGAPSWSLIYTRPGSDEIKPALIGKLWRTLQGVDLKGWHPGDSIPQTKALADNKLESYSGTLDGWLVQLVNYQPSGAPSGADPFSAWPTQGVILWPGVLGGKDTILASAKDYFKSYGTPAARGDWGDNKVLAALRKLGGGPVRNKGARGWHLPPLPEAQAKLAQALTVSVADLLGGDPLEEDLHGGEGASLVSPYVSPVID